MTNSRAKGGIILLNKYTATTTEASHLYTPSAPLLPTKYSKILIFFEGENTADFILQCKINADATAYYMWGAVETGTGPAGVSKSNQTQWDVFDSTVGADESLSGTIELIIQESLSEIHMKSDFSSNTTISDHYNGSLAGHNSITSIEILVSTSTWKADTKITIYGIPR